MHIEYNVRVGTFGAWFISKYVDFCKNLFTLRLFFFILLMFFFLILCEEKWWKLSRKFSRVMAREEKKHTKMDGKEKKVDAVQFSAK